MKRVVITGIGVVAPTGVGRERFWEGIVSGESCSRTITLCDPTPFRSKIASEVPDFDPKQLGLTDNEIFRMDRYIQFAIIAARESWKDSGLDRTKVDPTRVGVSMGTAIGGSLRLEQEYVTMSGNGSEFVVDPQLATPYLYHADAPSSLSGEIAREFGALAGCNTVSTGCTAGIDALAHAYELIRDGEADIMLAGASEAGICPITIACFDAIKATSTRNNDPQSASRPFDGERNGFVLGEGCAVLILEELEHAIQRNAHIYAEFLGFGSSLNAYHMTGLQADGDDMVQAIHAALKTSGVKAEQIEFINAHGSSTKQNDLHETNTFKKVWKEQAYLIPINSIKSMIGHSLGAIGAIELACSALAIDRGIIPPTINYSSPDPKCDLDYVPNQARKQNVKYLVSTASGFGGFQSAVVLSRLESEGGIS